MLFLHEFNSGDTTIQTIPGASYQFLLLQKLHKNSMARIARVIVPGFPLTLSKEATDASKLFSLIRIMLHILI